MKICCETNKCAARICYKKFRQKLKLSKRSEDFLNMRQNARIRNGKKYC